jgi:hypothetical protein
MPIDTHEYSLESEPPDLRERRHPRRGRGQGFWPLMLVVEGVALLLASAAVPPLPAWIMMIGACGCIGRGLVGLVPESRGLRDHRQ